MRGFDFENKYQLFRRPKYTGITLTLLSVLVLVCMVAVWEKMPKPEKPVILKGLAFNLYKDALEPAILAFEKETGIILQLEYQSDPNNLQYLQKERFDENISLDLAICSESFLQNGLSPRQNWVERIPLAYHQDLKNPQSSIDIPLFGWIAKDTYYSKEALLFCRFLSAPTRGQFYFAEAGFSGVRGDRWSIKPSLNLLATSTLEDSLHSAIDTFQQREGVTIHTQFLEANQVIQVLMLTSQSEGKQYLPDLAILPPSMSSFHPQELPFDNLSKDNPNNAYITLLSDWSHLSNTAKRFHQFTDRAPVY